MQKIIMFTYLFPQNFIIIFCSTIATQALEFEYPFPNCIYTIRRDEIDGPILKYARVGDQIVHRWECLSGMISFA